MKVASDRLLPAGSRYVSLDRRLDLYSISFNSRRVREIAEARKALIGDFQKEETAARDHVMERLKELSGGRTAAMMRQWWQAIDIGDWCRDYLRNFKSELALPNDEAQWPAAESIPSLWNFYSYRLARIKRTAGDGRRIQSSDYYDAQHYAAASYYDVLVTDDAEFRATCGSIASRPFEMMSFDEFHRDIGSC